jgi:WXG100 family type VII secretion target
MAHIKIHFDGLAQQVSALNNYIQTYESLNTRMKNLTEQMSAGWQGEASRAFLEMMQKYSKEASKLVGVLGAFRGYASNASTDFEEVDKRCASLIRNSF